MKKRYELWLDESGDFIGEKQKQSINKNPSLVGGILIDASKVINVDYDKLIGNSGGHACEMDPDWKVSVVLPALAQLQKKHKARQVFFENMEYEDEESNRQLYLRIITEGILQLLLELDAVNESVELSVIIAQRQDVQAKANHKRIRIEEYIEWLKEELNRKCRDKKIYLHPKTKLYYEIDVANCNQKLQLADFACNTRLTRKCRVFANSEEILNQLYSDAYLFNLHELGSMNYINRALSADNISDAVIELCTTKDKLSTTTLSKKIVKRMESMSYYQIKAQLKQCASEITTIALKTEDYIVGIGIFEKMLNEVLPIFSIMDIPIWYIKFTILIQLVDMYLQTGDIIHARKYMEQCKLEEANQENTLENLLNYYRTIEKEALLCIDEFDYHQAVSLMEKSSKSFENILEVITLDDGLRERFSNIKSEYYGDSLCMQIYAMMFLQRDCLESYQELTRLSDIALAQYPNFDAELERHRQYRCHIEAEAGNYEEAIRWLFKAKGEQMDTISEKSFVHLLDKIYKTESNKSVQYYLMYYLHIMSEAKIHGWQESDIMASALQKSEIRMLNMESEKFGINESEGEMDIQNAKGAYTKVFYHPMEIVWWKYATYLYMNGDFTHANRVYKMALTHCTNPQYITMRITSLAILAEWSCCLIKMEDMKKAKSTIKEIIIRIAKIKQNDITNETRKYLEKFETYMPKSNEEIEISKLWKASRLVTY